MEAKGRMVGTFRAVSLTSLIGLAKPQEPVEELAIFLKNSRGEQIVLSGGEIFLQSRQNEKPDPVAWEILLTRNAC